MFDKLNILDEVNAQLIKTKGRDFAAFNMKPITARNIISRRRIISARKTIEDTVGFAVC